MHLHWPKLKRCVPLRLRALAAKKRKPAFRYLPPRRKDAKMRYAFALAEAKALRSFATSRLSGEKKENRLSGICRKAAKDLRSAKHLHLAKPKALLTFETSHLSGE